MMNDQPQQQAQQQPQQQPRKKRSGTRLKDKTDPEEVEFNSIGQHSGEKQNKFATECGVITRSIISIDCPDWRKVKQDKKDLLWMTIKNRWSNLNDDDHKKKVLKTCNSQWRSFKRRLKSDFVANDRDPAETYDFLDKATVEKFKVMISSDEFKEKSEKARASSIQNTNPARLGPHGYRGNKAKWEQEMASGELEPRLYEIKSERSRDFVMGRRYKDKAIPPNVEPLVDKLLDAQTKISKGELAPGPGEDLLTLVIGPEHPGRTRGVGHDVGVREGMKGIDQKKRKRREKESVEEIHETLKVMQSTIVELQAKLDRQEYMNQAPNDVRLGVQKNSSGSTRALDPLDAIKDPALCNLVLPYGDMNQRCAVGLVFPYGNGLMHSIPLRENHLKVLVDRIIEDYENFPLPVTLNNITKLQGAVGISIQWPRDAIVLTSGQQTEQQIPTMSLSPTTAMGDTNMTMRSQTTSSLLRKTATSGTIKNMSSQTANKDKPIETLRDRFKTNPMVHIVANSGILEVDMYDFSVTNEEFLRLLKKLTVDVAIITAWQLILHSMVKTRMNQCAYLNPYKILGEACQKNSECNQQHSFLSGHYVMRWMHEFVMSKQYGFLNKADSIWNAKTPYEEKVLLTTVAAWAREFLNRYMIDMP